jgi:hypothetical protein
MITRDGNEKAVTTSRQGFNETRVLCGIGQRFPQLVDRGVQAVVEVDESVFRPDLRTQLLATHHIARSLQQHSKYVKGLFLNPDSLSLLPQFSGPQIHLKRSEPPDVRRTGLRDHLGFPSRYRKSNTTAHDGNYSMRP